MSQVKLHQTSGNVFIKSNGEKQKVTAEVPDSIESLDTLEELYGENTVPIKNNDLLITEQDSYAINIQDENDPDYTTISLFPQSRARISVKGKEITNVELIHGLFRVETKNPIHLPLATIKYLDDSTQFFYIEVKEENVSISLVSGYAEITHKDLGETVEIQMQEQATVTPSSIEGPLEVEQKFKNAFKKQKQFESRITGLYDDAALLQQKAFISNMEENLTESKRAIQEIKEEGGTVPAQMKMGVQKLENQLQKAKKEFREELKRKRKKAEKEQELTEAEKKFKAREQEFEEELEKMSEEVSSGTKTSSSKADTDDDMTELEKKIQAAGDEIKSEQESSSQKGETDDDMTELEKKIQAAGDDKDDN